MIRIIRKSSLAAPIVVLLVLLILIGPLPRQEAEAAAPALLVPFLAAAAIGGFYTGAMYAADCYGGRRDWNWYDFSGHVASGALVSMAWLAVLLFHPSTLVSVLGVEDVAGVASSFGDILGDFFELCVSGITSAWDALSGGIRDRITENSDEFSNRFLSTLEALCAANGSVPDEPFDAVWADFTDNVIDTSGMSITTYGMEHNTSEGASWRMLNPGTSYLEATFDLAEIPDGVILSLTHLSSASAGAPGGGYSPVDIYINGSLFRDNHDVAENHCGWHGYAIDKWQIQNYLVSGENTITIAFEDDPWAYTHYWIQALAISPGIAPTNMPPRLSHPRVDPLTGDESSQFEFSVDYYDAEGQAPHPDGRKVYFSDGRQGTMTLKSGLPCDGTYHYTTTFPIGSYSYWFLFPDTEGGVAKTEWQNGPYVWTTDSSVELLVDVSGGPVTNNIEIKFCYGPDLGDWDECQEWPATQMPQPWIVGIDSGKQLMFSVSTESDNHSFTKWVVRDDEGNIVREKTDSHYTFVLDSGNIHATAYLSYTPLNYTISGTVLRDDGVPVPGGVALTLSSSEQTLTHHTDDGNFSFTGVKGGVSVTVTPSATGYAFTPSSLVYNNLYNDHAGESITAYSSDASVPMTSFLNVPPSVSQNSWVSFSWIGRDDVSAVADLLYQYKLDGVDANWSGWVSDTSKSYNLPNGPYTFWVRAKDEAGNINQAPVSYTFVVNAAPKVVSASRVNRSVWASRITLEMSTTATQPSNTFILLPNHSGVADPELVPVRIHRIDEITPVGANETVANELGLPSRIVEAEKGWMVTLPDNILSGESAQYDIVWGKIKYFGWQDFISVPAGFPNGGNIQASFLSDDFKLWRSATKRDYHGGNPTCDDDGWIFMDICDRNGIVKNETILRFVRGECWEGNAGTFTEFDRNRILNIGSSICFLWEDFRYEFHDPGEFRYIRYGLQLFDRTGASLNSVDGTYFDLSYITFPKRLIDNSLWLIGRDRGTNDNFNYSADAWFHVIDNNGNERIPKTVFDTIQNDNGCCFNMLTEGALSIGENVLFLWEREWETNNGDDRIQIVYQIRNSSGEIVKAKTELVSVLSDSEEKDDRYQVNSVTTDNEGKVWISYLHEQSGVSTQHFYVILGSDGEIWEGPFLTIGNRAFNFSDREGKIWAEEGGQFFVLNNDNTIEVEPRMPAWTPTQAVGNIAAHVRSDGYRLYDRWSPQLIVIDVPSGVNPNSMELFDLNLWDNDLHPANVNLKKGDSSVWSQSGQFTGYTTVDMSGTLSEGANVLTMTQDDFSGGQVLVTFPYDADTDEDGILDGWEDANHNGLLDSSETDPCSIDTDGDGIQDGTEMGYTMGDIGPDTDTNVFQPDLDPTTTTDPLNPDTDGDGLLDGEEDTNHNGRVDEGETDPFAWTDPSVIYIDPCNGNTPCYSSIQNAIDAAGPVSIIKVVQGFYDEDVTLNTSKTIALQGGWDWTFTTQSSNTTINSLTISSGTIVPSNIILGSVK